MCVQGAYILILRTVKVWHSWQKAMESPFLGFQKSHKDWFKFEKNYVATKIYFEYIFGGKLAR